MNILSIKIILLAGLKRHKTPDKGLLFPPFNFQLK